MSTDVVRLGQRLLDSQPKPGLKALQIDGWPECYVQALPSWYVIEMQERRNGAMAPYISEMLFHSIREEDGSPAFADHAQAREFAARAKPARLLEAAAAIAEASKLTLADEDIEGN